MSTIDGGGTQGGTEKPALDASSRLWTRCVRRLLPLVVTVLIVAGFAVVVWFLWRAVALPLDGCSPHLELQFGGFATCGDGSSLAAFRWSLVIDTAIAVLYSTVLYGSLVKLRRRASGRPEHLDPRLQQFAALAPPLAAAAGVAAILENAILLGSVRRIGPLFYIDSRRWADLVLALAVVKWLALFFAVGQLVWHVINFLSQRTGRADDTTAPHQFDVGGVGLCLSGGGIRSAGFSLGAMREFEHADFLDHVDVLAAVSGGNYVATGWMMGRRSVPVTGGDRVTDRMISHLLRDRGNPLTFREPGASVSDPSRLDIGGVDLGAIGAASPQWPTASDERRRSRAGRHRFLYNGPGGLGRAIVHGASAVFANVVQLGAIVLAVGWPLGWFIDRYVYRWFGDVLVDEIEDGSPAEQVRAWLATPFGEPLPHPDFRWAAGMYLIAVGLAVVALTPFVPAIKQRPGSRSRMHRLAELVRSKGLFLGAGLGAAGLVVLVLTAAAPWLLVAVYSVGGGPSVLPIGAATLAGVAGAIGRLISNPVRTNASRLGGGLLVVALLVFLGKVVHDSAGGRGFWHHDERWIASLVVVALAGLVIDTQVMSVRELYRARLTNSFVFDPTLRPEGIRARLERKLRRLADRPHPLGLPWTALDSRPELVVCCAASRVGLASNGMPAESFTISQKTVAHHRPGGVSTVDTADYLAYLERFSLERFQSPAGWMSTSGAAFASAMGRSSLGTTNALLAAVNVDLGVWLPSPRQVQHRVSKRGSPNWKESPFTPVRLGHLINEIFGFYAPDDDHVFIADGGHVENLGLIELLRRGATTIVCVDASRDRPGSFDTLLSALRLADTELAQFAPSGTAGVVRTERRFLFDLTEIEQSTEPALTSVYRIPFCPVDEPCGTRTFARHRDRFRHGQIYYLKLQRSLDQALNLRLFAHTDPQFPNYSTGNQLLDDQQFIALLLAGRDAALKALDRMEEDGLLPSGSHTPPSTA